uniref:Uncharacterized protein n=1 Tax=Astyanax mexicanus TaxID=7994 RepID=A0A8B9H8N4_ASTMX
ICSIFFQPFLIICNTPAQIGSLWAGETRSTLDQMRDSDSLWRYSTPLIRRYYKNKINKIKELRSSGSSGTAQLSCIVTLLMVRSAFAHYKLDKFYKQFFLYFTTGYCIFRTIKCTGL